MYEKITYKNHINESLQFGETGIYVNENELHNYSWDYSEDNNKISNFSRGIKKYNFPVVIASLGDKGITAINKLMEYAEKDILAKEAGRMYIGDYYLPCYITESKKQKYSELRGYTKATLTVVSDSPAWVRETTKNFKKGAGSEGGKNLDFAFDFPYDFASPSSLHTLVNTSFADTDFKMIIYGEVTNPSIYVGGHLYEVTCYVASGEYLVIDSKEKTVKLVKRSGEIANKFKDRNKSSYIFEKIPSGEIAVSWIGDYAFDITLYEERSEPKWT